MLRSVLSKPVVFQYAIKRYTTAIMTKIDTLQNGLRVATEESRSPLAAVTLCVLMGSRFENACNNGMSYFIEHMAYKGFKCMNKECLESTMSNIGGRLFAHTSREHQTFTAVAPAEFINDLICIMSYVLHDIEFPNNEIEKLRVKMNLELTENDVNPKRIVFDYLHQSAFQGTALAQPITPSPANLAVFDGRAASDFMQENYLAERVVLGVSGGVSHDNVVDIAGRYLAREQPCDFGGQVSQRFTGSGILYRNDAMPFLHVAIAVEAPGYNSDDYFPLLLAKNMNNAWDKSQGGNINHASLLVRASATSQLCEMFNSFYIAYSDVGLWGAYFVCKMLDADEFVSNLCESWMHLCTTTISNDLERARNITTTEIARNIAGVVNSSLDIGVQVNMINRRKNLNLITNELSYVTPNRLIDVCNKYIYDKSPVMAAVGPSECLPDYERVKSGLYWLRL